MPSLHLAAACAAAAASLIAGGPPTHPPVATSASLPPLHGEALLKEFEHRAFQYFWQKADDHTFLVNDRASNVGKDSYFIASLSATGYGLASLPAGVENGWITRAQAAERARRTLTFLSRQMPSEHGWFYHFVDKRTGERVWRSEVSSIDTGIVVIGALACGQYFHGTDIQTLADDLYNRLDWTWLRTRGGSQPDHLLLCHGWTPEKKFLRYDWDIYSEGTLLYLLGMGASHDPVPPESWRAFRRDVVFYGDHQTLTGGPLFIHEMCQGFFDLRGRRDALGYDYAVSSVGAIQMNRQFCIDHAGKRRPGFGPETWGLNAGDGPRGYRAYRGPGSFIGDEEDGTLSPTGAIASVILTPDLASAAADALYARYGAKLWGHYGFADAFNVGKDWYDADVIGIDLGMALVAIENHRSGLYWRLIASHPATARAYAAAGLHPTTEPEPRPLLVR